MPWLGLPPQHPFGLQTLPYGSFRTGSSAAPRVGVAVGDDVLDLTAVSGVLLRSHERLFAGGDLDRLLAAGPAVWHEVRSAIRGWFGDPATRDTVESAMRPATSVLLELPFTVADYVDFYASEHHARTLGRLLRPGSDPLPANWKHLPVGYHGRAGTVVVSGTPLVRPHGQVRTDDGRVVLAPTRRLDLEAEVGFVVGAPWSGGAAVPLESFAEHVFGVCLVNDWSARDVQAFEYVPLGPFLGKSFATAVSPWVVPLAALQAARVRPPARDPRPLPYLDDSDAEPWGLDLRLEVLLNGHRVAQPPFRSTYWTGAQQLAHLTVNGAGLRTGDLFASGTVSGPHEHERGSLMELSEGGRTPVALPDGSVRTFLEDGDEVVVRGRAPGPDGTVVGLGEVRGTVLPARPAPGASGS